MRNWLNWILVLTLFIVAIACNSENMTLPSGASLLDSTAALSTTGSRTHEGNSGSSDDDDDDNDEDEDDDDNSGPGDADDDDDADDNVDNSGPGNAEDTAGVPGAEGRLRSVLLSFSCQLDQCTLELNQGTVIVPETARTERELQGDIEVALSFAEFAALLRPGLPIRARGVFQDDGSLLAERARIDDEVKISGFVTAMVIDSSGAVSSFTVEVVAGLEMEFTVAPGANVEPFSVGTRVRVEGLVPDDITGASLVFVATEVEVDD